MVNVRTGIAHSGCTAESSLLFEKHTPETVPANLNDTGSRARLVLETDTPWFASRRLQVLTRLHGSCLASHGKHGNDLLDWV